MNSIELQTIKNTVSHTFQNKITRLLCVFEFLKRTGVSMIEIEYVFTAQGRTIHNLVNASLCDTYGGINSNSINKMYSSVVNFVNTYNEKTYSPRNFHGLYVKKHKINSEMVENIKYLLNV